MPRLVSSRLLPTRCCSGWSKAAEQLQLDALYAVLRDRKAGAISDDEAIKRLERSSDWLWTAMDPTSKLLVVVDVGCRTLAMAQCVVHQVSQVLASDCVPLFFTDGLKDYPTALLTHFGPGMSEAVTSGKVAGTASFSMTSKPPSLHM